MVASSADPNPYAPAGVVQLRRQKALRSAMPVYAAICFVLGISPFVTGGGGYAFHVPGTDLFLPSIDVIPLWIPLYEAAEWPAYLAGAIAFPFMFFPKEETAIVQPFWVAVFWLVASMCWPVVQLFERRRESPRGL